LVILFEDLKMHGTTNHKRDVFGLSVLLSKFFIVAMTAFIIYALFNFDEIWPQKSEFICRRNVCKTLLLANISVVVNGLPSLDQVNLKGVSQNCQEVSYVTTCIKNSSSVGAKTYRHLVLT
jgi:hypothetical protein